MYTVVKLLYAWDSMYLLPAYLTTPHSSDYSPALPSSAALGVCGLVTSSTGLTFMKNVYIGVIGQSFKSRIQYIDPDTI